MKHFVSSALVVAAASVLAACAPGGSPAVSGASSAPAGEPVAEPTPVAPIVVSEVGSDGSIRVAIDPSALEPAFYSLVTSNPSDPYYHFHTEQEDLFLGVELYTHYGAGWTGELGSFPVDCTTHGICVYLDVDGTGPLPGGGPATSGQIDIAQLEGGYDLTLTGIVVGQYVLDDLHVAG